MLPSVRVEVSGLILRVLSAAVLAPPVILALYAGPPYSDLLVLGACLLMAWEGARVATGKPLDAATVVALATIAGALVLGSLAQFAPALAVLVFGAVVQASRPRRRAGVVLALGGAYLGCAGLAFLWLRQLPDSGLALIVWLVAAVWATDMGAYFVGRGVGGARLCPRVSPGKTWAGLLGGMASAGAASAVCALYLPVLGDVLKLAGIGGVAACGMLLALVAQGGDLLESAFKRYFRVKDAGSLIPGHGGLLDRADGLLSASIALAVIVRLTQGGP